MNAKKRKSMSYAYPSSEVAVKHGFRESGCWYVSEVVETARNHCEDRILQVFPTKRKAQEFAESLKLPWDYWSAHEGSRFDPATIKSGRASCR